MSEGKVAIITGGGRGMGAAIARELHAEGYRLALMSPSGSAEKLAAELGGIGVTGSVLEIADNQRLFDATMEAYGRVDALVTHTAHPPKGELLDITDDDWHLGLEMMLLNVIRLCRMVTPVMEKQGGGAIVNITTYVAFEPDLKLPVSCVIRSGLAAFAKLYSDRYATAGIRMNSILPGYIDSLEHDEARRESVPMKRIGKSEEIAKTAAFLLSDGAGYITGQSLRVDGGATRHV